MPDIDFANLGGECLDWHELNVNFDEFLNQQSNELTVPYSSPGPTSVVRHSTPWAQRTVQGQEMTISSFEFPIPILPTFAVRSLVQRPKLEIGAQRLANLTLHTLRAYPLMMLRHNALPPFIHPYLVFSDMEDHNMEPLTNCINLVHMVRNGIHGSRKLFWKNVRLECERLCEEVRRFAMASRKKLTRDLQSADGNSFSGTR